MSIHLSPLTVNDQARLNQSISSTCIDGKTPVSTWSFPPHYIWKDLFTFSWTDLDGWLCLFAESSDGIFMPLPPVGPWSEIGSSSSSPFKDVLSQVIEYMEIRNHENTYKSQRAAYNEFVRAHRIRIAPYQIIDRGACFTLFHRWVHQKEDIPSSRSGPNEDMARMMLRDPAIG